MIKVSGACDDTIEITGQTLYKDFFLGNQERDQGAYLVFSDGTVLAVTFEDEEVWRFSVVTKGSSYIGKDECQDLENFYSDVVFLGEDVKWVILGNRYTELGGVINELA